MARSVLALFVLAAAAALLFLLLSSEAAPLVPSPDDTPLAAAPQGPGRSDTVRAAVPDPQSERAGGASAAPPDPAPVPKQSAGKLGRVAITVRDRTTGALLEEFTCTWQFNGRSLPVIGENGLARWGMPIGHRTAVLVEANGYEPHRMPEVQTSAVVPTLDLVCDLARATTAVGLEVWARAAGRPVGHLQVAVWSLQRSDGPVSGNPLWQRRRAAADGHYRLPNLPAGFLALEIQAVDEEGAVLPFQTFRKVVAFKGVEQLPVHADLAAGVLVTLEVVDSSGQPAQGEVAVRTVGPNGVPFTVGWVGQREGRRIVSDNGLPVPGPVQADEALAPGDWLFAAQTDDGRTGETAVFLDAGTAVEVRIAVR